MCTPGSPAQTDLVDLEDTGPGSYVGNVETRAQSWHSREASEVAREVGSEPSRGLTNEESRRRLEANGPNALPEAEQRSMLAVIGRQLASPLIFLLLGAAVIAFLLGETSDAIVIAAVVTLNAAIGAVQEGRAERALAALRKSNGQRAHVLREGREANVDARDIVVGDVLLLTAGDAIVADARVIEAATFLVAEAALTGESVPVAKQAAAVDADVQLADRANMIYSGTHATAGRARAVVVATGGATEIGNIAALTESAKPVPTPLERRIDRFGRALMIVAGALFCGLLAIGLLRDVPLAEMAMIGISQVVGMIPEGLPAAMTIALAVGVQRMARRRAIVRRLSAVETLGSTTVICTDKTGTLTKNEMTVTRIWIDGADPIAVGERGIEPLEAREEDAHALLEASALCNDAQLRGPTGDAPIGDPTEIALLEAGRRSGISIDDLRESAPRRSEIPFDSATKMMATEHERDGRPFVVIKGAPEALAPLCGRVLVRGETPALDDEARRRMEQAARAMARDALRVLAVARIDDEGLEGRDYDALAGRAVLLGLVGEIDPPRPEVAGSVGAARAAGIRAVMVTGDHKATAIAIARELGIAREGDVALDGAELSKIGDEELAHEIGKVAVFARVHPAQKLRIVEALQKRGEVVAMTGDGVNDAPALARADVGIAMGITGTEVAKEAAKIVVTDDNFATIVAAIEEGRVVYRNIKKAILFLFATSLAEVLVLLLAIVLGYPPPFAAVMILWNNLVTEGVITINLILDPAEGDEMTRKPISPTEPLLDRVLLSRLAFMTPAIVVSTLGWLVFRLAQGIPHTTVQTETFTLLAVCEWFNVLNCRSERRSALSLSLFSNRWLVLGLLVGNLLQVAVIFVPALNRIFHTEPFDLEQMVMIGVVGSLVLWIEEARKLYVRLRERRAAAASAST